jgi:LytR cell envelope-related transcriptional attenuator/LytR_cpsA_psr family
MAGKHRRGDEAGSVQEPVELTDSGASVDEDLEERPSEELVRVPAAPEPEDATATVASSTRSVPASPMIGAVLPGPPPARRMVREERRQRARRLQLVAGAVVAVLVLAAVAWAITSRGSGSRGADDPAAVERAQGTLLLQVVDGSSQTIAGVLLAHDRTGQGTGFGALIPDALLLTPPGLGAVTFGATSATGGASTGPLAVSDALGVTVDGGWKLTQAGLAALLDSVGGVDVTVDENVQETTTGGASVLLIRAGRQHLSGALAATYATYLDSGAPEQERLARFSTVLQTMLAKLPASPSAMASLVRGLGAASVSTLSAARMDTFLDGLRADAAGGRLTFDNVPTHPLDSSGTVPTLVVDNTALSAFVKADFAGSLPRSPAGGPLSVLVQNGVGTPGLDEDAHAKLTAAGLTYVGGGNATTFANPTSVVLIADGTDASRNQGAIVAKALGLPASDIRITGQGQNLADVLVVIGDDFKP